MAEAFKQIKQGYEAEVAKEARIHISIAQAQIWSLDISGARAAFVKDFCTCC